MPEKMRCVSWDLLEGMRAVRADCELQLKKQLVDTARVTVARATELPADLAELRRPEGERRRETAIVRDGAVGEAVGGIDAHAGEPALRELVVGRGVETIETLAGITSAISDCLESPDERVV